MIKTISKNLRKKSGIYIIINIVNGKRYIGSSSNIYNRLHEHFHNLRNNKHHTKHLQNSYNKYGKDSFTYDVLEFCELEKLEQREQFYIDSLTPEYNKRIDATNNYGIRHSEEFKEKISKSMKQQYLDGRRTPTPHEEIRIKCRLYDISKLPNIDFIDEFVSIGEVSKYINNEVGTTEKYISTMYKWSLIKKRFLIVYEDDFTDNMKALKNMIYKNMYKLHMSSNYLYVEHLSSKFYCKSKRELCDLIHLSPKMLNSKLNNNNNKFQIGDYKIELLAEYKPI